MTLVDTPEQMETVGAKAVAPQVFISYRSEDKYAAYRLCAALESRKVSCWISPRNVPVGQEGAAAIVEAIGKCKVFVMVLSSDSRNAKQMAREAELADRNGCQIISFRIENVEPPPGLTYFLGNIQWLDAFDNHFEEAVKELSQLASAAVNRANKRAAGFAPLMDGGSASHPVAAPKQTGFWLAVLALAVASVVGVGSWLGAQRSDIHATTAPIRVADKKAEAPKLDDVRLEDANADEAAVPSSAGQGESKGK